MLGELGRRLEHLERLGTAVGGAQGVGPRPARLHGLAPLAAVAKDRDGFAEGVVGRVDLAFQRLAETEREIGAPERAVTGRAMASSAFPSCAARFAC